MLQILEPWDLAELDATHRTHLVVEAMRRAYRDRHFYLGDPDFVEIPQRTLTSADYADGLRAMINSDTATHNDMRSGKQTPMEGEETTHFSTNTAQANHTAHTPPANPMR